MTPILLVTTAHRVPSRPARNTVRVRWKSLSGKRYAPAHRYGPALTLDKTLSANDLAQWPSQIQQARSMAGCPDLRAEGAPGCRIELRGPRPRIPQTVAASPQRPHRLLFSAGARALLLQRRRNTPNGPDTDEPKSPNRTRRRCPRWSSCSGAWLVALRDRFPAAQRRRRHGPPPSAWRDDPVHRPADPDRSVLVHEARGAVRRVRIRQPDPDGGRASGRWARRGGGSLGLAHRSHLRAPHPIPPPPWCRAGVRLSPGDGQRGARLDALGGAAAPRDPALCRHPARAPRPGGRPRTLVVRIALRRLGQPARRIHFRLDPGGPLRPRPSRSRIPRHG